MAYKDLSPQQKEQLAELMYNIGNNPKTRKQTLKAIKEIDPDARFSDLEAEDLRQEIEEKFSEQEQLRLGREAQERQQRQRDSLVSSGRYSEEDLPKIEETMQKYGITDYEAGAKLYGADVEPARPTPEIKGRVWEMPSFEGLKENPQTWGRKEAYKVIDELRSTRR